MRSPHHPPASSSASLAGHNPATATLDWTTARRRFPQRLLPRKPSSLALKRAQQPPAAAITSRPRSGASRPPSTPQSNRHSTRGTIGTSSPAGSFPGGFRTTAPVQAEPSPWAVIRNLSQNAKCPNPSAMSALSPTPDVKQPDRQGRARLARAPDASRGVPRWPRSPLSEPRRTW
jgi:hypothetical protein